MNEPSDTRWKLCCQGHEHRRELWVYVGAPLKGPTRESREGPSPRASQQAVATRPHDRIWPPAVWSAGTAQAPHCPRLHGHLCACMGISALAWAPLLRHRAPIPCLSPHQVGVLDRESMQSSAQRVVAVVVRGSMRPVLPRRVGAHAGPTHGV